MDKPNASELTGYVIRKGTKFYSGTVGFVKETEHAVHIFKDEASALDRVQYLYAQGQRAKLKIEPVQVQCGWFARCENAAVDYEPHPILHFVPVCARCQRFVRGC